MFQVIDSSGIDIILVNECIGGDITFFHDFP